MKDCSYCHISDSYNCQLFCDTYHKTLYKFDLFKWILRKLFGNIKKLIENIN